ncbi:MAG: alanine--tRNA ligase [Chloroflexi bacterium]|nr:alanine--tRNA ligase [Chloroflexota bacterium]
MARLPLPRRQQRSISLQGAAIRKAFLDFFQGKGHLLVPSASLIPAGDPTLLLTSAGMVQFKPYFTGEMKPPQPRLTTCQKCFRVTDVDSVGDAKHLTFFEMLGNFSVGDYFKREAIAWAWEFVTQHMKLPTERLWATVFLDDDEAYELWNKTIGVPQKRIRRYGEEDNFWGPAGEEGPCGPCSEVHYDFGGPCRLGKPEGQCGPDCDCGRFVELWNLVFMQFYHHRDGHRTPLPRPNIDTGMGLERAAMILQGVPSVYETDLFKPIVDRVAELAGVEYGKDPEKDRAIRVVAEHARAATFLIADGVVPSNEGRGYVLRRLIRRAIRFGHKLGLEGRPSTSSRRTEQDVTVRGEPVEPRALLSQVAEVVIQHMGDAYPELAGGREFVLRVLQLEEAQFANVIKNGMQDIEGYLSVVNATRGPEYQELGELITKDLVEQFPDVSGSTRQKAERLVDRLENKLAKNLSQNSSPATIGESGEEWAVNDIRGNLLQLGLLFSHVQTGEPLRWTPPLLSDNQLNQIRLRFSDLKHSLEVIPGLFAFRLHDTYGFPVEVTAEIAREHGLEVDVEGFQREMEAQQKRSRAASGFGTGLEALRPYEALGVGGTRFLGYETTTAPSVVVGLLVDGVSAEAASEGQRLEIVLRETPFYPEGGGQVGDAGRIEGPGGLVQVEDTQAPLAGLIVHRGRVVRGAIAVGETVAATVDAERRRDTACNHTATHLLHAALRQVLGTHVRQAGSLVAPDRLRFDFTHVSPLSKEELSKVEELANDRIWANVPVRKRESTYRQAIADGALAFFGERYADQVRVVEVANGPSTSSGQAGPFSLEVCGGTHVQATGDIGLVHILSESGIGSGMRRIEAVTGRAALALVREREGLLERLARKVESAPQELEGKVASLVEELARLRRELAARERESSRQQAQQLLEQVQTVDGLRVVAGQAQVGSSDALREAGDWLRDKLGSGVVVLGAVVQGKPMLLAMVTPDLVGQGFHAGEIVKEAAKVMGGGGGGRPEMAQAGGRDVGKLEEALQRAVDAVRRRQGEGGSR